MSSVLSKLINLAGNVTGTLKAANGGLATNASAFTGVVKAASGVFSAATIVDADVSATANIAGSKLATITQSAKGVDTSAAQRLGTNTNDAASAGNIGEYPTLSTNSTTVTGNTSAGIYTDCGVSLSLTAGDWDVEGWSTVQMIVSSGTGAVGIIGVVDLTDNSNNSQQKALNGYCNATNGETYTQIFTKARISITATTTYKLRFSFVTNSGSPSVTSLNLISGGSAPHSLLRARRIR